MPRHTQLPMLRHSSVVRPCSWQASAHAHIHKSSFFPQLVSPQTTLKRVLLLFTLIIPLSHMRASSTLCGMAVLSVSASLNTVWFAWWNAPTTQGTYFRHKSLLHYLKLPSSMTSHTRMPGHRQLKLSSKKITCEGPTGDSANTEQFHNWMHHGAQFWCWSLQYHENWVYSGSESTHCKLCVVLCPDCPQTCPILGLPVLYIVIINHLE